MLARRLGQFLHLAPEVSPRLGQFVQMRHLHLFSVDLDPGSARSAEANEAARDNCAHLLEALLPYG